MAPARCRRTRSRVRALLARLSPSNWQAKPAPANSNQLARLVNRFERDILADTAVNELNIRQQIRGRFTEPTVMTFEALNEFVYRQVFHTPADDPWLGLTPGGVVALPNDGLIVSRP